jgi:excisionase family DNA binding protein
MAQQILQAQSALGGPDLLSVADAARRLGVTEADVMTIIESGELRAKKIGESHRIKRSELEAYLSR